MPSTKNRLAAELTKANAPLTMIAAAIRGYYDDFESSSAMPITDLVRDCREVGLTNLAARAVAGEFDGSAEEADAWFQMQGRKGAIHG